MHVGADLCSAVYISDRFLLTAAHCVKEQVNGAVQVVTIRDGTKHQETIAISRTYVHYNYIEGSFYNDIALLELGKRVLKNIFN